MTGSVGNVPFTPTIVRQLDVTKSEDRSKVTDFIRSNNLFSQAPNDTQAEHLELLSLRLKERISEIKSKTDGILNFLKYLFQWRLSERSTLKMNVTQMESLKEIIENIRQSQPKTAASTATETPSGKTSTTPAKSPAKPIPVTPQPSAPTESPEGIFAPPPPPPAPDFFIADVSFANEPKEPGFSVAIASGASRDNIQDEINQIRIFVDQMKAALAPIETAITREQELRDAIAQLDKEIRTNEDRIEDLQEKRRILAEESDVSYLHYTQQSPKRDLLVPFYSEAEFARVNATRRRKLPSSFLKSQGLRVINTMLTEAEAFNIPAKRAERQAYARELDTIKRTQNNEIPFNDFQETLRTKQQTLQKWERALRNRTDSLNKKPTVPVGRSPVAPVATGTTGPTEVAKSKDREALEILENDRGLSPTFFGAADIRNLLERLSPR